MYFSCIGSGIYFVAMNYTVHAIMYFYYFLTALGYRPRWALAVTVFQLSQVCCCCLELFTVSLHKHTWLTVSL